MSRLSRAGSATIAVATSVVLAAVGVAVVLMTGSTPVSAAEVNPTPASGTFIVDGKGNGHGHGLSQYGARGAAIAGLKYNKILAFYYPGTTLVVGSAVSLRVRVTGPTTAVTVAYKPGLVLRWSSGSYAVPSGARQWRLLPSGSGLALQRLVGTKWSTVKAGLPARADFSGGSSLVRYSRTSATAVDYRGTVGAVRSGSGVLPINRLGLDDYVRGVAPREMPASWQAEAVKAQVVAARSYARYAYEHNGGQAYDICDTTSCQVYGGAAQYTNGVANGIREEAGSNAAVTATANRVLTYGGRTIFAQFSASNGGMTASSNQPYFVTKADPYNNAASGDPYLNWTKTVSAASVASYYGLRKVTEIDITSRAGGSTWGGIVTAGVVKGVASNGSATSIRVTGPGLTAAMGLSYQYFHLRSMALKGHLDRVSWVGLNKLQVTGWTFDPAHTGTSIYAYVYVDSTPSSAIANKSRPDVQRVFKTLTANLGFSLTVTVPSGSHRVCVYGVALNRVNRVLLRCVTEKVTVNAIGQLASATRVGPGLAVSDPVGVGGTLTASGNHRVCAVAINQSATPGKSRQLCVTLTL